jgi:hypothetical protein
VVSILPHTHQIETAQAGKEEAMSTTKAKLLERFPGFENQLSSEGKEALRQALQMGNGDSFIVVRSGDAVFATLGSFEEGGVHCVALNDADGAVFFAGWTDSPLHSLKREEGRSVPILIVHET